MKSREAYEQLYSSYFVWTVVRNPWARAVSSYRMLSRYMRRECKVGGRAMAGRRRAAGGRPPPPAGLLLGWAEGRVGAEGAVVPSACFNSQAAANLLAVFAAMRWIAQDLVGGWDTVCRDVNHLPFTHNRNPECTITK